MIKIYVVNGIYKEEIQVSEASHLPDAYQAAERIEREQMRRISEDSRSFKVEPKQEYYDVDGFTNGVVY